MTTYEAMLEQYKKNQNTGAKKNLTSEENLKNYFTTWIPDNIKQKFKQFRIIPSVDGSTVFKEVKGHSIEVDKKWPKFLCPKATDGLPCPFCELRESLQASFKATGNEADKELAKKYNQKEMFVVKVIDREKEDEGTKFFRFNRDYTNQGVYDKIMAIMLKKQSDVSDAKTGRDLTLDIQRDQKGRPAVNSVMGEDVSPIHADETLAKSWVEDGRTWRDVYKVKPYEYLELIINGEVPYWDKDKSIYVAKSSLDTSNDTSESKDTSELVMSKQVELGAITQANAMPEDDGDDLPF